MLLVSSSDRLRLAAASRLGVPDDIRGSCLTGAGGGKEEEMKHKTRSH